MKTKYILGTLVMGGIAMYLASHSEKYHILIPIIFGALTILSIALGVADREKDNHDNTGCPQAQ